MSESIEESTTIGYFVEWQLPREQPAAAHAETQAALFFSELVIEETEANETALPTGAESSLR